MYKVFIIRLIAVVTFVCIPLTGFAAVEITSVSGEVSRGSTITISGSGFGTGPTVYKWDNFEGATHTVGNPIGAGPAGSIAWGINDSNATTACKPQVTSGGKTNSTKYIAVTPTCESSIRGFHYDHGATMSPLYVTYWTRWNGDVTNNAKLIQPAHPGGTVSSHYYYGGAPGVFNTWEYDDGDLTRGGIGLVALTDAGYWMDGRTYPVDPYPNEWVRGEFFGIESDVGEQNGTLLWTTQIRNGGAWINVFNYNGNARTRDTTDHWRASVFGRYAGGSVSGYDDIYIASSRARVEIGNRSVWENCTYREIQIPTQWSANSISINVNQASFSGGGAAYLYVLDASGTASVGYPIVFGQSNTTPPPADTTPPAPPTGVQITPIQ